MPMPTNSIPTLAPPCIFDRADGTNPLYGGVPDADGSIKINTAYGNTPGAGGYVPFFQETSDSPEIESGEQSTIVHKWNCDYYTAQIYLIAYQRGTYMVDSQGNNCRVLSTRITPVPRTGMRGVILTMTTEGTQPLFPNPPDEFDIEVVELNPALEKHPRYADLTYAQRYYVRNANVSDDPDLAQNYQNALNDISSSAYKLGESIEIAQAQQAEAQEMLFKKHKGEDSFYLAGYKVTLSQYYWYPQVLNPGGYIEDPVYQGGLPYYFWSNNGTNETAANIFGATATQNQNLYPQTGSLTQPPYGLSWLRQADTIHLNRTWWRLTRTWLGGPLGNWDNELYNRVFQPYQTNEYSGSVIN